MQTLDLEAEKKAH